MTIQTALAEASSVIYKTAAGIKLYFTGERYVEAFSEELTPEAFGAPMFGDATTALEAMFAAATDGSVIRFKRLLDTSRPLTCNANNLTMITDTPYSMAGIRGLSSGMQILTLGGFGATIDGVRFVGDAVGDDGAGATIKGLRFVRSDGSKDVDSEVRNSTLEKLSICIYAKGANLRATNNLFSTSQQAVVVVTNNSDECRGHRINSNRFHNVGGLGAAGKCVSFDSSVFASEVKNNYADAIYVFYEGPANNNVIDGNKIFKCVSTGINQIVSTAVGGWQQTGSVCDNEIYKNSPSYELTYGINVRLKNGRVSGNRVIGPRAHGIALIGATGNIISGNTIVDPNYNYLTDGSVFDGIYGDAQSISNLVSMNHVRAGTTTPRSGINVASGNTLELNWTDPTLTTRYGNLQPTLGVF